MSKEFTLPQSPPLPRVQSPKPEDSVSRISTRVSIHSRHSSASSKASRSSSVSATKAKAAARRAAVEAEAANLQSLQAIQKKELSLRLKRKALEFRKEIAKAQPEELVYAEAAATAGYVDNPVASLTGPKKPAVFQISNTKEMVEPNVEDALPPADLNEETKSGVLNPDAKSWVPGDATPLEQKPSKGPLKLPDSKRESEIKAKGSEHIMAGDFAH